MYIVITINKLQTLYINSFVNEILSPNPAYQDMHK